MVTECSHPKGARGAVHVLTTELILNIITLMSSFVVDKTINTYERIMCWIKWLCLAEDGKMAAVHRG